jgi:DNA-binding transcriptional LysR family regulator
MQAPAITQRQLSMFRAIMLHGSLSRAAEATTSSQPTLSRELARLEQLLGFALFDRISGRLRPTVRALALMQEVERSFVGLEQIAQRALALRTQAVGQLRLACLPALAHALVPRALQLLAHKVPDACVRVDPVESPWLEQATSEQRYDLALSEATQAPAGVALQPLLQANEVAVLPAAHPLSRRRVLRAQDFAGQRFISLAADDPYRHAIDAWFAQAQVQRTLCVETASAVAVCAMVRQGLGLSIVNPLTALEFSGTELVVRPLEVSIAFQVSLLTPEIAAPHPQRDALVQALTQAARMVSKACHAKT